MKLASLLGPLLCIAVLLASTTTAVASDSGPPRHSPAARPYDALVHEFEANDLLGYSFTNKRDGFLWAASTGEPLSEFGGFNVLRRRVLESWVVAVGSQQVTPGPAMALYRPHIFERIADPVIERVFVPDDIPAMSLSIGAREDVQNLRILLFLERSYELSNRDEDRVTFRSDETYMEGVPYITVVASRNFHLNGEGYGIISHRYRFDEHRQGNFTVVRGEVRSSGYLELGGLQKGEEMRLVVGVGKTEAEALERALDLRDNWDDHLGAKESRLEDLVRSTGITCSSEDLHLALNFALTSLDSLLMEEPFGKVVWAGLPWFNQGWGRDTFISLRGGLATGRHAETQAILRSFAAFQRSSDGRIPNLISDPANPPYNSADAIWWLVKVAYEYYLYTGNRTFLEEIYPTVSNALKAGFEAYGDEDGLLLSSAKETWMDTSADPRRGKPVEIEALWIEALSIGAKMADLLGLQDDRAFFQALLRRASSSFDDMYWNSEMIYLSDYIDHRGESVSRVRPNVLLAYSVLRRGVESGEVSVDSLQGERLQQIASTATEEGLFAPWGVRSLSPQDAIYRPIDTSTWDSPAYHNGNVWPWLSGAAMEVLAETHHFEEAGLLLRAYEEDFLRVGNVGSGTEIYDGDSRSPKGTWTQAWSAAEFLRAFHQVVLGVRPSESGLVVSPNPLPSVGEVASSVVYRDTPGRVTYSLEGERQTAKFESGAGVPLQVRLKVPVEARGYRLHVREGRETTDLEGDGTADIAILNFTDARDVEVTLQALYDTPDEGGSPDATSFLPYILVALAGVSLGVVLLLRRRSRR